MKTNLKNIGLLLSLAAFAVLASCGGDDGKDDGGTPPPPDSDAIVVTFNTNGGNTIESEEIWEAGEFCPIPFAPRRAGYVFRGWYTDPEFTDGTEFDIAGTGVRKSQTLYAKWDAADDPDWLEQVHNIFVVTAGTDAAAKRLTVCSDYNNLKYITIPATTWIQGTETDVAIETCGAYSFANKINCVGVTFPSTFRTVGSAAFYNSETATDYSNVRTVWMEEGVTTIEITSFVNNHYLEKVHIPSTVTSIGVNAFTNCGNCTFEVMQPDPTKIVLDYSADYGGPTGYMQFTPREGCVTTIKVPAGKKAAYLASPTWGKMGGLEEGYVVYEEM